MIYDDDIARWWAGIWKGRFTRYDASSPEVQAAMKRVIQRARELGAGSVESAEEMIGDISVAGALHAHNNKVYLLVWRMPRDYPNTEQERIIQAYY